MKALRWFPTGFIKLQRKPKVFCIMNNSDRGVSNLPTSEENTGFGAVILSAWRLRQCILSVVQWWRKEGITASVRLRFPFIALCQTWSLEIWYRCATDPGCPIINLFCTLYPSFPNLPFFRPANLCKPTRLLELGLVTLLMSGLTLGLAENVSGATGLLSGGPQYAVHQSCGVQCVQWWMSGRKVTQDSIAYLVMEEVSWRGRAQSEFLALAELPLGAVGFLGLWLYYCFSVRPWEGWPMSFSVLNDISVVPCELQGCSMSGRIVISCVVWPAKTSYWSAGSLKADGKKKIQSDTAVWAIGRHEQATGRND